MILTQEEEDELKRLRDLQARSDRFLLEEEYNRLKYLTRKYFHNYCINPVCTGYHGNNEETECPECGGEIFKM